MQCLVNDYLIQNGYKDVSDKFQEIFGPLSTIKEISLEKAHQEYVKAKSKFISVRDVFGKFKIAEEETADKFADEDKIMNKIARKILKTNAKISKIQKLDSNMNYRMQIGKLNSAFSTNLLKFGEKEEINRQWKKIDLSNEEEQIVLKKFEPIGNRKVLDPKDYWKIHLLGSYLGRNLECNRHWTQIIRSLVLNHFKPELTMDYDNLVELQSFKVVYRDLIKYFTPREGSVLDQIVCFLLTNQNDIKTHGLNQLVSLYDIRELRKYFPSIYLRRYTTCKDGETDQIQSKLKELIEKSRIVDLRKFSEEIKENTRKKQNSYWKIILIGSYLSQDLKKIRHAHDVVIKSMELLFPRQGMGRYSPEEDEIILNEISTNGLTRKTFGKLSKQLERSDSSVRNRYFFVLLTNAKKGFWAIEESKTLIDCLFKSDNQRNLEYIQKINYYDIRKSTAAVILNRNEDKVRQHWDIYLKPILVRYHLGVLNMPWKHSVLQYLIDKKIVAFQDINFEEIQSDHPGIGAAVLAAWFGGFSVISSVDRQEALHVQALDVIARYKNRANYTPKATQIREELAQYYGKCRE